MTEAQAERKIREMSKDAMEYVQKEGMRLFCSGGIDTSKFDNGYMLPKILLHVALLNCAEQYRSLSMDKRTINNLKHF